MKLNTIILSALLLTQCTKAENGQMCQKPAFKDGVVSCFTDAGTPYGGIDFPGAGADAGVK